MNFPRSRYTKWTPAREQELTERWNSGATVPVIADAMGVTHKAVYKKVWTLRSRGAEKRKPGRPRKNPATKGGST